MGDIIGERLAFEIKKIEVGACKRRKSCWGEDGEKKEKKR